MLKTPKKTRWSVTLTDPLIDGVKELVEGGVFLNKGSVIRASLRLLFEKYSVGPFKPIKEAEDR